MEKKCTVDNCNSKYYSKGFCNSHYQKNRRNIESYGSLKIIRDKLCTFKDCNKAHVAMGFCENHYNKFKRKQRWEYFIALKGNKCKICEQSYHFSCYEFHHRNPLEKKFEIGFRMLKYKMTILKEEVDKCDLLCANCHRKYHYDLNSLN